MSDGEPGRMTARFAKKTKTIMRRVVHSARSNQ